MALVELRAEMFEAMGVANEGAAWREAARSWFETHLSDRAVGVFVADVDGVVVACALGVIRAGLPSPAVVDGRDVAVSNVVTRSGWRGRGNGRAVFDAVIAWAREDGVTRAELMATSDGRRIYERAGFAPTEHPAMRAMLDG
ncbi:GNAT family N-acetyltransferase [Microbacterium sp. NPDC056052]|uniref:GNAT family N-acetyltransferase n=1 Tax=Microbacterium sp. NPDC056052 TaxID=3345695 RepID=UPI0035E0F968